MSRPERTIYCVSSLVRGVRSSLGMPSLIPFRKWLVWFAMMSKFKMILMPVAFLIAAMDFRKLNSLTVELSSFSFKMDGMLGNWNDRRIFEMASFSISGLFSTKQKIILSTRMFINRLDACLVVLPMHEWYICRVWLMIFGSFGVAWDLRKCSMRCSTTDLVSSSWLDLWNEMSIVKRIKNQFVCFILRTFYDFLAISNKFRDRNRYKVWNFHPGLLCPQSDRAKSGNIVTYSRLHQTLNYCVMFRSVAKQQPKKQLTAQKQKLISILDAWSKVIVACKIGWVCEKIQRTLNC